VASPCISAGSERYARQKLGVVEDFIERFCLSGFDIFQSLMPEMIEPAGFCVSLNLTVPGIVKIDLRQLLEKLTLLLLIKLLNRVDDFSYGAH